MKATKKLNKLDFLGTDRAQLKIDLGNVPEKNDKAKMNAPGLKRKVTMKKQLSESSVSSREGSERSDGLFG